MEIVINKTVRPDLSNDEYKYLCLLEFHTEFINGVQKIRKTLNIPVANDGETVTSFAPTDEMKLNKMVSQLMLKLQLPLSLFGCVESIIKWGRVLMTTKPILVFSPEHQLNRKALYNKKVWPKTTNRFTEPELKKIMDKSWYEHNQSLLEKYGDSAFTPVIQINKPITKKQLLDAVEREWDTQIAPAIEDFKKSIPFPVEITKIPINEVEDYLELLRLRREGKKHSEIAVVLSVEEDSVREKYSKITKFLKKIGFPSLNL